MYLFYDIRYMLVMCGGALKLARGVSNTVIKCNISRRYFIAVVYIRPSLPIQKILGSNPVDGNT